MTNLTFYHLTKTNILTAAGIQFPGLSEQTGKATSKGIEFDLNGNIGKNWSILFNYAYTDAKVTEDNDAKKNWQHAIRNSKTYYQCMDKIYYC